MFDDVVQAHSLLNTSGTRLGAKQSSEKYRLYLGIQRLVDVSYEEKAKE